MQDERTVRVYTDGACSENGKHGATGGIGVFFGPGDPRNISEPLAGDYPTNNRAEITAVLRALEVRMPNLHQALDGLGGDLPFRARSRNTLLINILGAG